MLATYKPRDVIQFVNGAKRGLLAQVAVIEGVLRCLSRDMDGTPHIFELTDADDVRLIGVAAMGPKPEAPKAEEPAAIEALTETEINGLLEPLPPEIKPQPLDAMFSAEEAKRLVSSAYAPYRAARRKRTKKPKAEKAKPEKVVRAPIGPLWTAIVRNGMGEEMTVTIPVREGTNPANLTGAVINIACKKKGAPTIAFIRPFTVSDWTRMVKAEEPAHEPVP